MTPRHAICIVVDGLRASALGAYGGGGHATPHLDGLASQSLVAEWMWAAGPDLVDFYRALDTGQHSLRWADAGPLESANSLAHAFESAGGRLLLATDEPQLPDLWMAAPWSEAQLVDVPVERAADSPEQTALARLFAVAGEQWFAAQDDASDPSLAWIHARGWHGPWDAPAPLHEALLAEGDPAASLAVTPPDLQDVHDPDELLVQRTAYAAQTAVLDDCMGGLLAAIDASGLADQTMIVLTGARGFALGEHGTLGPSGRQLYSEFLHTPLVVRRPGESEPAPRHDGFNHPCDLTATLMEWFGLPSLASPGDGIGLFQAGLVAQAEGSETAGRLPREWSVCSSASETSLRTAGWMLRISPNETVELFAKPDDRWEANEIAVRCPATVEQMQALLACIRDSANAPGPLFDGGLAKELTAPVR